MNQAEGRLIELMRDELEKTTHGGAPGKPAWREKVSQDIHRVFESIANDVIEIGVGLDYSEGTWEHVRAMLIAYGSGSEAGGGAIWAGPPGREVWNDDLSGRKQSEAHGEYPLPAEFNQKGNDFVNNAMRRMKPFFDDIIDDAIRTMPQGVIAKAVHVV